MKKIILGSICGLLALTMVGCGTSGQDAAIKNLSNQLDRVTNTVNSLTTSQFTELSPSSYMDTTPTSRYAQNLNGTQTRGVSQNYTRNNGSNMYGYVGTQIARMQANAYEQDTLKQSILSQTAMLKNELGKKLKLSKNQVTALNNLTNTISKYTTSLNNTKNEINSSIRNIRKYNSPSSYRAEQVGSYYQTLNNHLDARLCYFRNLINSIEQAQNILTCENCGQNQNNNQNSQDNNVTYNNQTTTQNVNTKNIDTYAPYNGVNQVRQNNPNTNYNNGYNYNNDGYNYGYNANGNYNNGYNNGYVRNNTFNPNRNTDTYAPRTRNIDTYRYNPNNTVNNGYYNQNNNAVVPANSNMENDNNITENNTTTNDSVEENKIIKGTVIKSNNENGEKRISKTQEVKRYHPANSIPKPANLLEKNKENGTLKLFEVDRLQTNKKIEKLIKG